MQKLKFEDGFGGLLFNFHVPERMNPNNNPLTLHVAQTVILKESPQVSYFEN